MDEMFEGLTRRQLEGYAEKLRVKNKTLQSDNKKLRNNAKEISGEILEIVADKPVLLGNEILLDWVDRLQARKGTP